MRDFNSSVSTGPQDCPFFEYFHALIFVAFGFGSDRRVAGPLCGNYSCETARITNFFNSGGACRSWGWRAGQNLQPAETGGFEPQLQQPVLLRQGFGGQHSRTPPHSKEGWQIRLRFSMGSAIPCVMLNEGRGACLALESKWL
jgi:hypothetical protein